MWTEEKVGAFMGLTGNLSPQHVKDQITMFEGLGQDSPPCHRLTVPQPLLMTSGSGCCKWQWALEPDYLNLVPTDKLTQLLWAWHCSQRS